MSTFFPRSEIRIPLGFPCLQINLKHLTSTIAASAAFNSSSFLALRTELNFCCFPRFMQVLEKLTREEFDSLTSQNAMSKTGRGGRRTLPYAFTEHGALQVANCSHLCASETR